MIITLSVESHIFFNIDNESPRKRKDIKISSNDNTIILLKLSDINNGEIAPAENQAAETVFKNLDRPLSWFPVKFFINLLYYAFAKF